MIRTKKYWMALWGGFLVAEAGFLLSIESREQEREMEQTQGAHESALRAREAARKESLNVAKSKSQAGRVAFTRGDLDSAAALWQSALDIREKLAPDSLVLAESLNDLGTIAWRHGDLVKAEDIFQRSLDINEELAPNSLLMASSFNNLGIVAVLRGDLVTAEARHRRALRLREKLAPYSLELASSFNNLGFVAWKRRDFGAAAAYFRRTLEIREELAPDSLALADALNNLGTATADQGDLSAAEEYHRRALEIRKRLAPDTYHLVSSFNNLGFVAWKHRDLAAANRYFQRALEIQERLAPESVELALTLDNLGNVAMDLGDLTKAESSYRRALKITEQLAPGSVEEAMTLHRLGDLSRRRHQPRRAREHLVRAIDVLEGQVKRLGGSHHHRASFRARYRDIYRDAIEVLLELGLHDDAFHILERSRSRSFLEMLAERDLAAPEKETEKLRNELRTIAVQYDRLQREIADSSSEKNDEKVHELLESREELYRKREWITEEIRRTSPEVAALHYPQPLDLRQTRETLDSGTILLSYSVGQTTTNVFAVTREGPLGVETVPVGEDELRHLVRDLAELVPRARPGVETGELEAFRLLGQDLYERLVGPVADVVATNERILVVPDGPLHLLPWSALLRDTGDIDDKTGRSWQYLAEWKPLHTVLSATVYAELQRGRRREVGETPQQLAAFGDALYPGEGAAPADVRVRSAMERGLFDEWEPLPHTRREVEEISSLFPPSARRSYLGAEATEEAAKAVGRVPRILHFAAHGHVDDQLPLDSALVLTLPDDPGEDRDNGLLQVWEIFERVRLDADLVVLSACASALGEELSGEGLIGLTRAFQYAGARSVVASLWSVQDSATAELMIRFYRHMRDGLAKDQALRAAQLELIRGPIEVTDESGGTEVRDFSAPYYWAAFQIYGDWK